MRHTIIYHGRFSLNFERLHEMQESFTIMRPDDKDTRDVDPPSDKVDGIIFGYMEKSKQGLDSQHRFFAVKVEDVVLDNPIQLVPDAHTDGKGFGPTASQFGDKSAKRLLKDIIAQNPNQRTALARIYDSYFGPYE